MFLELLLLSGGLYAGASALFGTPEKGNNRQTASSRSRPSSGSSSAERSGGSSKRLLPDPPDPEILYPPPGPSATGPETIVRLEAHPAGTLSAHWTNGLEVELGRRIRVKEQEADRDIRVAMVASGLLASGYLLLPPLWVLGAGLVIWQVGTQAVKSIQTLAQERKVSASVVELALAASVVAGGFMGAASAGFVLLGVSKKVAARTESVAHHRLLRNYQTQGIFGRIKVENGELLVPAHQVSPGDPILVDPGQRIPVDGKVSQGGGLVEQGMLTGEDSAVDKGEGAVVQAATRLVEGQLTVEAERVGADTTAAKVEQVLEQAAAYRFQLRASSDALGQKTTLPTLLLGGAAYLVAGLSGTAAVFALPLGRSLRYTGPISLLNTLTAAAESSVLVRDPRALQRLPQVDTVVFDKTGALLQSRLRVVALHSFSTYTDEEVLELAATAEQGHTHPVAEAIREEARALGLRPPMASEPRPWVRSGIQFWQGDESIHLGSEQYMRQEQVYLGSHVMRLQHLADDRGHLLVLLAVDGLGVGAIELSATLREEAQEVISLLKMRTLSLALVSGDREPLTLQCAARLGIDRYVANASTAEKVQFIQSLQDQGRTVCFVGDGIRNARVAETADVSVSLCGADSSPSDAAQVVLLDRRLSRLPMLFSMSEDFTLTMNTNVEASITPAVFSGLGVLLFKTGLLTALGIYYTVSAVALLNSILPAFRQRERV